MTPAVQAAALIAALQAYRQHLKRRGEIAKAAVVAHCIVLVKRLAV